MIPSPSVSRCVRGLALAVIGVLLFGTSARAQFNAQARERVTSMTEPGVDAPLLLRGNVSRRGNSAPIYHILPASTEAGRHAALSGPAEAVAAARADAAIVNPLAALPNPGFFPADLRNLGGAVVGSGSSVDIYYNCPGNDETCWGDPEGFLIDLSLSKFIHVADQYVGLRTNKRYPLFNLFVFENGNITTFNRTNVENAVEDAAAVQGVGPNHIFHLFLPQGVDVCSAPGECYSPDNPSTFVLCAYHSSTTSSGILYTVEPYQDVPGCVLHENASGYPNGELSDSTNSPLSHELFELITDPFGDTWVAENSSPEAGNEIADICHGPGDGAGGTIVPTYQLLPRVFYQTQLEYSNLRHGCVVSP